MATKKKTRKGASGTGKRTSKNPPKKTQSSHGYGKVIAGTLAVFFAFFLILTFFPWIDNGFLGGVRDIVRGLFGFGYYIFPFLLLFIVFTWAGRSRRSAAACKTVFASFAFMFLLCLIHLLSVSPADGEIFGDAVKSLEKLYAKGVTLQSGGAVGGFVCAMLARAIGWVATAVLASLGLFVCVVFLFGSTPMQTIRAIGRFFGSIASRGGDVENESEEESEEESGEESEEESEPVPEPVPTPPRTRKPAQKDGRNGDRKGRVSPVLVDDREITDETPPEEPSGNRRFIYPEEEQREDFARVPTELFGKELKKQPESPAKETGKLSLNDGEEETPAAEPVTPASRETSIPDAADSDWNELLLAEKSPEEETAAEPLELPEDAKAPYIFPPLSLLAPDDGNVPRPSNAEMERTSRKLEAVLDSFKVKARVIGTTFGPTVTRYEVLPETGVRVKQIANLADDLALHLSAESVRIENIPSKGALGIEIPNTAAATVRMRSLIENSAFRESKSKLLTALGEDVAGNPVYLDIGKMPHLMIAGTTGSGKSVCMNSLIISLLYHASPDEVKFIMIDPKKVEMADYSGIPHLLVPVITDVKKAAGTLNWACAEMEKRYSLIQEVAAKNLVEYNAIVKNDPEREQQPYIVIFIDELADLMMTAPDEVEDSICRLAQKARAAGIHLVLGTQRPTTDVITGLIKANVPSRIAFKVSQQMDSRIILDQGGAEKLLGRGDMLYYPVTAMKPIRVQGAFVDGKTEVVAVTEFIKQAASASYNEEIMSEIEREAKLCGGSKRARRTDGEESENEPKLDEKFLEALELAIDTQNVSTSMLQTRLGLGYARAARIVGMMEQKGYIGEFDPATKKRRILITREELMELKMKETDDADDA